MIVLHYRCVPRARAFGHGIGLPALLVMLIGGCQPFFKYSPVHVASRFQRPFPGTVVYQGATRARSRVRALFSWNIGYRHPFNFRQAGTFGNMFDSLHGSLRWSFSRSPLFHQIVVLRQGQGPQVFRRGRASPAATVPAGRTVHFLRVYLARVQTFCNRNPRFFCFARLVVGYTLRRGLPVPRARSAPSRICIASGRCFRPGPLVYRHSFKVARRHDRSAAEAFSRTAHTLIRLMLGSLSRVAPRLAVKAIPTPRPVPPPPPPPAVPPRRKHR